MHIGDNVANRHETSLEAGFDVSDDLLWQATRGQLMGRGPILVRRSGRIGPVVELMYARRALPEEFARVSVAVPFAQLVEDALDSARISGGSHVDVAGVFPLGREALGGHDEDRWEQWALHAQNAAVARGLNRSLVDGLIGALIELQDNVYQHSDAAASGLVAYAVAPGAFEFVVADAGVGILASLTKNPEFSGLADSGEALRVAASDGASRFDRNTGHGFGIGQLFKALAHDAGELRFRSGDHAMSIRGDRPSLTGEVKTVQKAWLDGLIVSVRCVTNEPAGNP